MHSLLPVMSRNVENIYIHVSYIFIENIATPDLFWETLHFTTVSLKAVSCMPVHCHKTKNLDEKFKPLMPAMPAMPEK